LPNYIFKSRNFSKNKKRENRKSFSKLITTTPLSAAFLKMMLSISFAISGFASNHYL